MRSMLFAASLAIAAGLWVPGAAAPPGAAAEPQAQPPAATEREQPITFAAYRDWRNNFIERRRDQLGAQLAAANLTAARKARLQQVKEYYDGLAGLPAADRDRRFRERFDQIDSNHDGAIDAVERAAWRDKQRDLYARRTDRTNRARPRPTAVADDPAPTPLMQ